MNYKSFIKFFRWKKLFEPNLSPFWKVGAWDCIKWWRVVVVANCSKFKASEEFLHVPLLTGGSLLRLLRSLRLRRYQLYLLESPPNLEEKSQMQTVQSTKLQKSSYMHSFLQGVPAETFEAIAAAALPAIPTWKPQNWEEKSQIQTAQCTKLQKSSYMYRFFSFSQGGPYWGHWGRGVGGITSHTYLNPKEKSQNYSKEPKLFKNYLWYQFVVPENLKKKESWPYYIILIIMVCLNVESLHLYKHTW